MALKDDLSSEPVYTIGHAARKLGVAVPTLRMYEHAGLIIPFRTPSNRRLYSSDDIARLQIIIELIRVHGLNLEAIKRIAALVPCWQIIDCPKEKYRDCPAYTQGSAPCWLLAELSCGRTRDHCRNCAVYLDCPKTLKDPRRLFKEEEKVVG